LTRERGAVTVIVTAIGGTMSTYAEGQPVRFTGNRLGLVERLSQHYFEPEVVNAGDMG
jgi:hypothetical protein